MTTVGGVPTTGRRFAGPAADLVELDDGSGVKLTAIVVHDTYQGHSSITKHLRPVLPFLQNPGVNGILPLVKVVDSPNAFLYKTGTAWSVAELVRSLADLGESGGVRAGLELCYLVGQILTDAAEGGARHGVDSHGAVDPWRILLRADGQVWLAGYGVPQVEIATFLEDESLLPREDAFRYCPPERLEGRPEDLSSDIFTLALVAFELVTGRPVYDGLISDIRQQAVRAEGGRRLYQMREQLSEGVREVLARAIKYDPDARYRDGNEFVYAVHDLLGMPEADGPSLQEVVQRVRQSPKRGQVVLGGQTGMLSREALMALREELDDPEPRPLPPPKNPRPDPNAAPVEPSAPARWGRVARPGAAPSTAGNTALPASDQRASPPSDPGVRPLRRAEVGEEPRRALRRADVEPGARRLRRIDDGDPVTAEVPVTAPPLVNVAPPIPTLVPPPEPTISPQSGFVPEPIVVQEPAVVPEPVVAPEPILVPESHLLPPRVPVAPPPVAAPAASRRPEELIYVQITVDGGPPQRTRLKNSERLADTVGRLVDVLVAPPTDLQGGCAGWYRIAQGSQVWSGDSTVAVLDPEQPVELRFVPNRVLRATFTVPSASARFEAPVGTAVPFRSIVACLRRWLGLSDASQVLYVNGRETLPLQILEEFLPSESLELELRG